MACVKPKFKITYSDEKTSPEEERKLIAQALIVLFQLDTKMGVQIEGA